MARPMALLTLLTLLSCQSIETDAESSAAPEFASHPYHKLCVSTPERDLRLRRAIESALAAKLIPLGIEVVELGQVLFPGTEHGEDEVRRAVRDSGADGFLTFAPLEAWTDERWVPPSIATTTDFGHAGHPYGWGYSTTWFSGGYTVARPRATFDVRLVDVATEKTAWIASVEARGSSDASWTELRRAAAAEAVERLLADGMLATNGGR